MAFVSILSYRDVLLVSLCILKGIKKQTSTGGENKTLPFFSPHSLASGNLNAHRKMNIKTTIPVSPVVEEKKVVS